MKKKILMGSIIAVTILIGVSFTSVIGYRGVDSDIQSSPLFNIRTSRAIDEENRDLSCEYVGKGEAIRIFLPAIPIKSELIDSFSIILHKMDNKSFEMLIDLITRHLCRSHYNLYHSNSKIVYILNQLRIDPDYKKNYINEGRSDPTILKSVCNDWEPGCLFWRFLLGLLNFYDCILYKILEAFRGVTFAFCNESITFNN